MERIIENGLNSIRVGLEDFEQVRDNSARLTSAVRNVYAGILILAKGKLYELSPPGSKGILIRVVRPKLVNQHLELVPWGRKTIGYEEIKERFEHFRLKLDWAKVERIQAIRHDLEHFYHGGAMSNVQEALADAATVIRSLLSMLNLDPICDLGHRWWEILLRNRRLFEEELAKCRATFADVGWLNESARAASAYFACVHCKSPLVRQSDANNHHQGDVQIVCAACGNESDLKATMEQAVAQQYFAELYEAHTRGGELPLLRCPRCRGETLVLDPAECAVCGHSLGRETHWCPECHNPLSDAEYSAGSHECPRYFNDALA
jgi:hypothetical protein